MSFLFSPDIVGIIHNKILAIIKEILSIKFLSIQDLGITSNSFYIFSYYPKGQTSKILFVMKNTHANVGELNEMQVHLSYYLVKHALIHRVLRFDCQGIETLQIKTKDYERRNK